MDVHYEQMVTNLMAKIRLWVAEKGGATGELRLVKSHQDGQWVIDVIETHPASTWHLGG